MVRIDDVYQKVLVIANKEQRGYITPQEFSLYANQAQLDIFEEYFYDLDQLLRVPGNNHQYADRVKIIEEKLQFFEHVADVNAINNFATFGTPITGVVLPDDIYRVIRVEFNNLEATLLNVLDFNSVRFGSLLIRPSDTQPIANVRLNRLRVVGSNDNFVIPTGLFYYKKPEKPVWNYVVTTSSITGVSTGEALYNSTGSVDFELHPSEETNLVNKILQLAGITMNNELYQVANQEEVKDIQQEKS